MVNPKRIRQLNTLDYSRGPILYWMCREQRSQDNWALLYAQELANRNDVPLLVVFCLRRQFTFATERMLSFMFEGLEEVAEDLKNHAIPFYFLLGDPQEELPTFVKHHEIGAIVSDFAPYTANQMWKKTLGTLPLPLYEVDARNIVPCFVASQKREFGAYTLRPKIHRLLPEFLESFPTLKKQHPTLQSEPIDFANIYKNIEVNTTIKKTSTPAGMKAAHQVLSTFLKDKLSGYAEKRNDPNLTFQSGLSPYLHFGHISSQRVALETKKHPPSKDQDAFLEELIVRRELSDNFCFYSPDYKNTSSFPEWAKANLTKHLTDERFYTYTRQQFESAKTHDPLWNAAQLEMVYTGKMHGYMRMYWAKKILEWTKTPQEALDIALYLNDLYELDGRDTNGYTGIAWSIGGVHDRPWFERPIFGTIRYMNFNGAAKKFDVKGYISRVDKIVSEKKTD